MLFKRWSRRKNERAQAQWCEITRREQLCGIEESVARIKETQQEGFRQLGESIEELKNAIESLR